jgi:hypothetical protein
MRSQRAGQRPAADSQREIDGEQREIAGEAERKKHGRAADEDPLLIA